jgi:hypothetical protein
MDKQAIRRQRNAIEALARSYADREAARLDAGILSYQHAVVDRLRSLVTRLEAEEVRS